MALQLYGTQASPFVRRIRLLMGDTAYEFIPVNFLEPAPRQAFAQISPIRKVPVLVDGEKVIFDSHQIQAYLQPRLNQPALTLEQQKQLTVIDAVLDSMVILMMARRSGLDVNPEQLIFALNIERIQDSLDWLDSASASGAFEHWEYVSMSLLAMVQWAKFRELENFDNYPRLMAAVQQFELTDDLASLLALTDPATT